jgi:transcriptional regulator with XRE-family HTH domain
MDFERLAAELMHALRGRRSQRQASARLGFKSNVFYRWERGRAWPSAATFFRCAQRFGVSPARALHTFLGSDKPALRDEELITDAGAAAWVQHLCENTRVGVLSGRAGRTRFVVSRWLHGQTTLPLPGLLALVEASSLRCLDFVAAFVDPAKLPSIAPAWRTLEDSRRAAYDHPWTQAVLRALELDEYRRLPRHRHGWIAERLAIDVEEEERCLGILARAGQIHLRRGRWRVETTQTVDTRRSREDARKLRGFWLDVARARQRSAAPGTYAYNVCSISAADLVKLQELHLQFFRDMQELVERSEPSERVVLLATQLISLGTSEG